MFIIIIIIIVIDYLYLKCYTWGTLATPLLAVHS